MAPPKLTVGFQVTVEIDEQAIRDLEEPRHARDTVKQLIADAAQAELVAKLGTGIVVTIR
jgi:hypothetical protein